MLFEISKFTIRIDSELFKKFRYIAKYNGHSANMEIKIIIKKHINKFEKKHGKIE